MSPEKPFVSKRALDEAEKAYKVKRFEDYMERSDRGEIPRHLAIQAFKEELEFNDVQKIDQTATNQAN